MRQSAERRTGVDLELSDKSVLITGASGGIGRALARAFAAEGARLALHAHRRADDLREWASRQTWRERPLVVEADVRSPASIGAAAAAAVERWGRLDACVVNAGMWPSESLPLHRLPEARIRETLETNLLGSLWTARAFLESLARTGPRPDRHGASLVFIGSTAGRFGERGHADYAASKAGLHGLVRTLKNEIVGIDPYGRVNIVEPGWTVTEMTRDVLADGDTVGRAIRTMPLRQLARARDIAMAVLLLTSGVTARHVSGEILTVAGGMEGRVLWDRDEIDLDAVRRRVEEG